MAWPTTQEPRTEFVTLRMTPSEAALLDAAVSASQARSRSDYVRSAVQQELAREQKRRKRQKHADR